MILKKKLLSTQPTIGSWLTLGSTAIAEIMANVGFDWLVVDLEHSTISIEQAGEMIRVIDLAGVTPLVRLTSNHPDQIKRVLDAGAHGIVVPMVNSREDAERAVSSVHYAPRGVRGVGLARAQGYGASFDQYLQRQKDELVVIVQIEHKDALDHIEEILSVPGVDGLIIGPYDLSCSLGIPGEFDKPEFLAAMEKIRTVAARLDSPSGLHVVEPDLDLLSKTVNEGHRFIAYSVDIRIMDSGLRQGFSHFNKLLK